MAHELIASIVVSLSDDPQEMASQISDVTGAWAELLRLIEATKPAAQLAINETRARPNGARRGRKPKLVAEPPQAA